MRIISSYFVWLLQTERWIDSIWNLLNHFKYLRIRACTIKSVSIFNAHHNNQNVKIWLIYFNMYTSIGVYIWNKFFSQFGSETSNHYYRISCWDKKNFQKLPRMSWKLLLKFNEIENNFFIKYQNKAQQEEINYFRRISISRSFKTMRKWCCTNHQSMRRMSHSFLAWRSTVICVILFGCCCSFCPKMNHLGYLQQFVRNCSMCKYKPFYHSLYQQCNRFNIVCIQCTAIFCFCIEEQNVCKRERESEKIIRKNHWIIYYEPNDNNRNSNLALPHNRTYYIILMRLLYIYIIHI